MADAAAVGRVGRIPGHLHEDVERAVALAVDEAWAARVWARDTTLWTADPSVAENIANRLGWLDLPAGFADRVEELEAFAGGVRQEGFVAAVVCGMGGSSLAPEVLAASLPRDDTGMPVRVLDSTDPAAVRRASTSSDPAQTLYLIASKSGTTTETLAFLSQFWQLEDDVHADIPQGLAGRHFVAVTDPPPSLSAIPHNDLFREVFLNPADVGGRYSALSYVGLVPAALLAIDMRSLFAAAQGMAARCASATSDNPGIWLGAALGALARAGRDKLTLAIEPRYATLGAWIEQLVAESTGKRGVGIVPVIEDALGDPGVYSDDRVFVRVGGTDDSTWRGSTDISLDALAEAGHPVIELQMSAGDGALGAEFFRWEFATAVCGAVLGINPFDEPNVTESKDNTRRVLERYRETGEMPADEVLASEDPLRLSGDSPLRLTVAHDGLDRELRRHLERTRPHGYLSIHAYIAPTAERDAALRSIAQLLRDRTGRAVTVGYGPRFLHSTGQLHKGGPPTGCFLQLTADHPEDLPIPGWHETFGTLIDAQAAGDLMALEAHELPVARVNLSADPDLGLDALYATLQKALQQPFGT
jgi:glucose-6-phosphate isomerase